jgi:predicted NBD/HSP70 family sugar kinase
LNQTTQQDRGSNQAGMRAYNERLVLSLVRRHGSLAKADIARSTGLSAQTVSVIMRGLEDEGLLARGQPIKGKVGQPSVPMHLSPDGAYAIGLKIGRRSADLVLMDFAGEIRHQLNEIYAYPTPAPIVDFAVRGIETLLASLTTTRRDRVAGIGIATPFELWNWAEKVGAPKDEMAAWRDFDLADTIGERCNLPIFVQNDATAACGAELIVGRGVEHANFVYFFIGHFVGGGVVLNNAVYAGPSGNAGAFGTMPMPVADNGKRQLIDDASIFILESKLQDEGLDPSCLWQSSDGWKGFDGLLDAWIEHTGRSLAYAIVSSCSVIDFPIAIIDGGFPTPVRQAIVTAARKALDQFDLRGLHAPDIIEGSVGANARVVGGALLPFFARYLVDQKVLLKL